ncbi:NAD nucleotidase [Agarivorans sp. B2Z047]|uniref:NAD nucleotidase n=1 Tax=Agarivorans sp. B2Z047 TaxID=2652721 RepID=UPI00128B8D89|nr:NAD nucleotidase [Agarivorans sp. B2Z047]MPW28097.1 NAD nucleotidase [Agarivorans sp. B2Z047]UQN44073.1 NAD nucleotidase [Agarivorans sp. B2Z047]
MNFRKEWLALLPLSVALVACNDNDSTPSPQPLSINVLHINDHHSHLQADSGIDLNLAGEATRVSVGGFPKVVAKINELAASKDNVLKLHAGDAITGDLYYTLFKGEADAALMNEVCFDAFALGNHEFDGGDAGLKTFLEFLYSPTCQTQVLAANVEPEVGVSPLAPTTRWDYFQPYMIKSFGDAKVGIIGIDIATKTKNSSSPDATTQFHDETSTAQMYIDELKEKGVNNIILLTHYQYKNDLELAAKLTDVDVIIGGDSHTLLGDFEDLGLNSAGDYPTMVSNLDGDPVCVAQAWQYSAVVGDLAVTFDGNGKLESCAGTPHLLLADSFMRKDANGDRVELTGATRTAVTDAVAANPNLSIVTADANATDLLAVYAEEVDVLKQSVVGDVAQNLCFERIPGQGRSTLCDVSATSANGSDISNLVAQAFLEQAIRGDVAIQNAGGVRNDVPQGDYTIGDAYTLLPFANTLVYLEMTGAEIKTVLNEAVDYSLDPEGSTGAYPYAAGLRYKVDMSQAAGSRLYDVEVKAKGTTDWIALADSDSFTVVTNNYIAGGRDGYFSFADISADESKFEDSFLDYAQSFVDYVERNGTIDKLPLESYSTQMFYDTDGNLQN